MPDMLQNILAINLFSSTLKVGILILIVIYASFVLIVISQVRSLNKIVYIRSNAASPIIQLLLTIYIIAVISLFFLALAIL